MVFKIKGLNKVWSMSLYKKFNFDNKNKTTKVSIVTVQVAPPESSDATRKPFFRLDSLVSGKLMTACLKSVEDHLLLIAPTLPQTCCKT